MRTARGGPVLGLVGIVLLSGCTTGRAWVKEIDPPRPTAKHDRMWEEDQALLAEERAQREFVPRPVIRIGVITDLPPESTRGPVASVTPQPTSVTNVYVNQTNTTPVVGYGYGYGYYPYRTSFAPYRSTFGTSFSRTSGTSGNQDRDRPSTPRVGGDWAPVPSYGAPAVTSTAPGH